MTEYNYDHSAGPIALTPLKAIRAQCFHCAGWSIKAARECASTGCSLWPYRMGRRPKASMKRGRRLGDWLALHKTVASRGVSTQGEPK